MELKIIFLGTPEFGALILEGLVKSGYKPLLVVTETDKPVGRKQIFTPPSVKIAAEKFNISVEQPEKIRNHSPYTYGLGPAPAHRGGGLKLKIKNLNPDLGIVAAYGKIIPKDILDIPKYGFINVHPSLLPKYRGPSPIQAAILTGDKETGVSIILMDEKMDSGKIISNSKFLISNKKITYSELLKELAEKGANLLIETIPKWIKGEIKPEPQDETKATYTKILKKEDGWLDWKKTAKELERQVRAFDPWPGSHTFWQLMSDTSIRVKILNARVYQSPANKTFPIGKVLVVPQNEIGIQCGEDFLVAEKLQMEGRGIMNSEEFLRGHPNFAGTILK